MPQPVASVDPAPLILASTSPYRAELLRRLGLPFETRAPGVEEVPRSGETPESCASRLAAAKAEAVSAAHPDACVLGSDQVAEWSGRLLGKPGSDERAIEQLIAFSGNVVHFHTAVCLITADGNSKGVLDTTSVLFRHLGRQEIERYVQRDKPLDCAGSFRSEGLGIALFDRIDSRDPTALIGLPLIATAQLLRQAGYLLP